VTTNARAHLPTIGVADRTACSVQSAQESTRAKRPRATQPGNGRLYLCGAQAPLSSRRADPVCRCWRGWVVGTMSAMDGAT